VDVLTATLAGGVAGGNEVLDDVAHRHSRRPATANGGGARSATRRRHRPARRTAARSSRLACSTDGAGIACGGMIRGTELIRLFEHDPDLLRHLPPRDAEAARDRCVVESLVLGKGEFEPPGPRADHLDFGFLVLEGILLRRVDFFGRRAVEVVGQGDFLRPFRASQEPPSLPCQPSWKVCGDARIAVLDRRFECEAVRWPGVLPELVDRLAVRARALSVQLAIAQLPRVDTRLLCVLWRLADRWGTVGPNGVSVSLRLSQATLADIVSARRPSVNAALRDLRERGALAEPAPGRWTLLGDPPSEWSEVKAAALVGDVALAESAS
jgi:hypothetical protein